MEILITDKTLATGKINLNVFKDTMLEDLDLEEAIMQSMQITQHDPTIKIKQILDLLRYQLEWGDVLIELQNQPDKQEMNFKIILIENKNRTTYDLGFTDTQTFNFTEKPSEPYEVIITQDLIKHPNYNLATNLSKTTFLFQQEKWQTLGEIKNDRNKNTNNRQNKNN